VFVIEGRRGIDALRQSKDYIKGYWWGVLGRMVLLALMYIVAMVIIQIPVALIGGRALSGLVSSVLVLFFIPFSAIYYYILFKNLREIKPDLAEKQTKEGTGFIKTSAIVGIVVPILFILLLIILAGVGVFYLMGHANFHPIPLQQ
jgi:hypothetical protein